jgi:hypothetical protein
MVEQHPLDYTTDRLDPKPEYYKYLLEFKSYKGGCHYGRDSSFTNRQLLEITPTQIECWMKLKVFGTPNPGCDAEPTLGRSSSLEFYKKALSYYMPDKIHNWSVRDQKGNPTRSEQINALIKKVKNWKYERKGSLLQHAGHY